MANARSLTTLITLVGFSAAWGCAVMQTRPVQEMSDTSAALAAAKEVQADTLAPELYRQASEWFFKAKQEYKFKNFQNAKDYSRKARIYAEQAEFESVRNGGNRAEPPPPDAPPPPGEPYDYPTPTGIPADEYEKRKADEEAQQRKPTPVANETPAPSKSP